MFLLQELPDGEWVSELVVKDIFSCRESVSFFFLELHC